MHECDMRFVGGGMCLWGSLRKLACDFSVFYIHAYKCIDKYVMCKCIYVMSHTYMIICITSICKLYTHIHFMCVYLIYTCTRINTYAWECVYAGGCLPLNTLNVRVYVCVCVCVSVPVCACMCECACASVHVEGIQGDISNSSMSIYCVCGCVGGLGADHPQGHDLNSFCVRVCVWMCVCVCVWVCRGVSLTACPSYCA